MRRWPAVSCSVLLLAIGVQSCGMGSSNQCPRSLAGLPARDESRIAWGRDTSWASAGIDSVLVECIAEESPAVTSPIANVPAHTSYKLAATAQINYTIDNLET